jgi:YggT family protein
MFIIGYFLTAFAKVLDVVLVFLMMTIAARAVLSWVSPDPRNPIVRFIYNLTEPLLYRVRKSLPVVFGGMDFSPVVVFLLVMFVREFAVKSLIRMSDTLL